jgi:hypothetical protein
MNTKVKIISPRPLKSKVFSFPEKRSIKTNNSKFICRGTIGANPFELHNSKQESPNFLDNQPLITLEMCSRNSISNCSPIALSHLNEDFFDFKSNLTMLIEENNAKNEIISILSTDHNDTYGSRNNIRSSMPPLRPVNPLLKKLEMEDSTEISLSGISVEIPFTKDINSFDEIDVNVK